MSDATEARFGQRRADRTMAIERGRLVAQATYDALGGGEVPYPLGRATIRCCAGRVSGLGWCREELAMPDGFYERDFVVWSEPPVVTVDTAEDRLR